MTGLFILLFVPLFLAVGLVLWDKLERKGKPAASPDEKDNCPAAADEAAADENSPDEVAIAAPGEKAPDETSKTAPDARRIVLVGSLSSAHQLSVCLSEGFYHIPASIAGADFERIDYVAIYQSRRFFGAAAGVRYYARVRSARLLPRYEIREIPRESPMMYVRFELEPWQILPVPIAPKGKGVTSARCTLQRLQSADNMHQLLKK